MAMDMDMDLRGVSVTRTQIQNQDSDTETPPRHPPTKRVHHTTNTTHAPGVSYKECMKNHAATIGGHALDGCCEFMPGPNFNLMDPTSLKCGACGCHRNFHRRDPDDPTPLNHHPTPARVPHSPPSASQLLLSLSRSPSGPSEEEGKMVISPPTVNLTSAWGGQTGNFSVSGSGSSRKRFRTKFTQEQKEKMYEFSEKIGWKLKKGEEKLIEEFVKLIGVERSVFKVWMHNNKHTSSTKIINTTLETNDDNNNNNDDNNNNKTLLDDRVGSTTTTNTTTPTTTVNYMMQPQQQQQQHSSSSNGNKSTTHVNNVGNCGTSLFDNHHHNSNNNNNNINHRQFNFGNGGSQEATQAQ